MPTELRRLRPLDLWHRLDEPGTVLVVLTSETCGACRAMKAALASAELPPPLELVEVDAAEGRAVVEELGAFHLPALYLFRDGELVTEVHAAPRPADLHHALAAAGALNG